MSNELFNGFSMLEQELSQIIDDIENATDILEEGAKEFVNDLLKLPKPISKIRKAGYTHLIKIFAYKKAKDEVEVGWGKYYGPMVEDGTRKMEPRQHLKPLWDRNKNKYYKTMIAKLGLS